MIFKSLGYAGLFFFRSLFYAAAGEYYHYVDDRGVRHFTENYADIPENYRSQVNIHDAVETPAQAPPKKAREISPEDLVIKKDELDRIYAQILKKREQLVQKKDKMGQIEYNKAAEQLNRVIKDYQQRSLAYEKEVEKYNQQINQTPSQQKPEN